jgi:hypothetical protein
MHLVAFWVMLVAIGVGTGLLLAWIGVLEHVTRW